MQMSSSGNPVSAVEAPNQYVETGDRTIAYRKFGEGPPIVLCLRLRGVMDVWDPGFLDALAKSFTVVVFDYSGFGLSTGTPSYAKKDNARDAKDLVDALGFDKVVIAGWSLGGHAAQVFAALYPDSTSHVVALGSFPPGLPVVSADPLFMKIALKPIYTEEDELTLFFEPTSKLSRELGQRSLQRIALRKNGLSPPIPEDVYKPTLMATRDPKSSFPDHDGTYHRFFENTDIPVLALNGDHDLVFPVENWYALNRRWPTLHIVTFPQAGHGPQHQHPELAAELITSFVQNSGAGKHRPR
jgi:pimeloyl-ACP methyl ester carboxylesterase